MSADSELWARAREGADRTVSSLPRSIRRAIWYPLSYTLAGALMLLRWGNRLAGRIEQSAAFSELDAAAQQLWDDGKPDIARAELRRVYHAMAKVAGSAVDLSPYGRFEADEIGRVGQRLYGIERALKDWPAALELLEHIIANVGEERIGRSMVEQKLYCLQQLGRNDEAKALASRFGLFEGERRG